jgi:hypothetical protein
LSGAAPNALIAKPISVLLNLKAVSVSGAPAEYWGKCACQSFDDNKHP